MRGHFEGRKARVRRPGSVEVDQGSGGCARLAPHPSVPASHLIDSLTLMLTVFQQCFNNLLHQVLTTTFCTYFNQSKIGCL